jgi:hypothetical protein
LEERSVKDDEDIFDSEVPPQTTEGVSPEAPDTEDKQPRAPDGKFATKDKGDTPEPAADAAPPEEKSAPPAPAEATSHAVPITALLDEREKRQAAERRLAYLEAQLRQQEPQKLPDPVEDAEGYTRTLAQTFEQRMQMTALRQSQFFATREFGEELVGEAMSFFDNQPRAVSEQFLREPSPFHAAVEWFKQQKAADERASPDFEASLRKRIEAELREKLAAEFQPEPSTRPNVPRSLAEASGSGRPPPTAGGDPLFD